jgi:hypothetical protein
VRPAIGHTARCAEPGVVIQPGRVHPVEVEWLLERPPKSSHRVGTDVVTQSVAACRPRIPSRQAFRRAAPVRRGTPQHRMLRRAAWRPGERASVVTMGVILSATRLGARCRRCHRATALATASLTMTATADQCLTSLMISTGKLRSHPADPRPCVRTDRFDLQQKVDWIGVGIEGVLDNRGVGIDDAAVPG